MKEEEKLARNVSPAEWGKLNRRLGDGENLNAALEFGVTRFEAGYLAGKKAERDRIANDIASKWRMGASPKFIEAADLDLILGAIEE